MKKFIYISLLIITISKINLVEFGKEIPFDINNNEFELNFQESGALFVSVTFGTSDILNLNIFCKGLTLKKPVTAGWFGTVILFVPNYTNKIILEYSSPSDEKGTILILSTSYEVDIKLNQTYEWKNSIVANFINSNVYELKYSINKAEKDAILEFKYDKNMNVDNNIMNNNPLKICHGEICENDITSYNIIKGESYKIYIALNVIIKPKGFGPTFNTFYLPSFSFHFIYEEEKQEEKEKQEEDKKEKEKQEEDKEEEEKQEEEKEKQEENKEEDEGKKEEEKEEEKKQEEKKQLEQNQDEKNQEDEKKQKEKKQEEKEEEKEEEKKITKKDDLNDNNNKVFIILIITGILLLGILVFVFVFIWCKKSKSNSNVQTNDGMKIELKEVSDNDI